MTVNHLTNVVQTEPFTIQDAATAVRFDYFTLDDFNCPIILFDHVRMRAAGFPPHPHAGLCVITYLLEDSPGSLRDRDSVNREIIVEPGDVLWFQMASGLIHEENPATDLEINQMQIWVNLAERLHNLPPATFFLKSKNIPVVTDDAGNQVRVVLGKYGGKQSPLPTTEPFTLLDARLVDTLAIDVPEDWSGIVYAVAGDIRVAAGGESRQLKSGQVVGARPGTKLAIHDGPAHLLFMARPLLEQEIVLQGMYAMSRQTDIDAAKRRFHAGEFGDVVPYPKTVHPDKPYIPAGQEPDLAVKAVVLHQATVRHYDQGWWQLHFRYCHYEYNNTETANGYRFVWESPEGEEKPYQLGGYIPYMEYIPELLDMAKRGGWSDIPYRDSF